MTLSETFQKLGWDLLRELLMMRDEEPREFEKLMEMSGLDPTFDSLLNSSANAPGPDPRFLGLAQGLDRAGRRGLPLGSKTGLAEALLRHWDLLCQEADVVTVQEEFCCSEWAARAFMREFHLAEPRSFGSLSVLTGLLAQPECGANVVLDHQKRATALLLRRSIAAPRTGDEPSSDFLYAEARQLAGRGPVQTRHLLAALVSGTCFAGHRWLVEAEFDLEELARRCREPVENEPRLPAYSAFAECYKLGPRTPGGGSSPVWTWQDSYQQKGWALWRCWNRCQSERSVEWLEGYLATDESSGQFEIGFSIHDFQFVELARALKEEPLVAHRCPEGLGRIRDLERAWWDWVRRESETLRWKADGTEADGLLSPALMLSCSEQWGGESLSILRSLLKIPTNGAYRLLAEHGLAVSKLESRLEKLESPQEPSMTLAHWLKESLELAKEHGVPGRPVRIQTEHLLVTLLRHPDSAAGQVLSKLGLAPDHLQVHMTELGPEL